MLGVEEPSYISRADVVCCLSLACGILYHFDKLLRFGIILSLFLLKCFISLSSAASVVLTYKLFEHYAKSIQFASQTLGKYLFRNATHAEL